MNKANVVEERQRDDAARAAGRRQRLRLEDGHYARLRRALVLRDFAQQVERPILVGEFFIVDVACIGGDHRLGIRLLAQFAGQRNRD